MSATIAPTAPPPSKAAPVSANVQRIAAIR
jgi:hypothetical protein